VAKGKCFSLFIIFFFTEYFFILNFFFFFFYQLFFFCEKKLEISCFCLYRRKTPESAKKNQRTYKIGQICQKSARNWQSARNIFCPPDDFQIYQNFVNLAEKTAIWQRCSLTEPAKAKEEEKQMAEKKIRRKLKVGRGSTRGDTYKR
jgi:hypothetical protein